VDFGNRVDSHWAAYKLDWLNPQLVREIATGFYLVAIFLKSR
jgi:hypothetical protein